MSRNRKVGKTRTYKRLSKTLAVNLDDQTISLLNDGDWLSKHTALTSDYSYWGLGISLMLKTVVDGLVCWTFLPAFPTVGNTTESACP